MPPLIGITSRELVSPNSSSPLIGAGRRYIDAIRAAGGIPVLIPLGSSPTEVAQILAHLDGVLLSGGEDVDPKLYGEGAIAQIGDISHQRDESEIAATQIAFARDLPLLGICRGLQVANVALGGSLYQDIATQIPSAYNHSVNQWEDLSHEIKIEPTSKLAHILKAQELAVNTLHHQSAKIIAPELQITARSNDGVIEALEASDRKFFICVQSHPEALWQKVDPRWAELFRAFIVACS